MRLTKLGLTNFKCFEDVNLDCAPLTIITGANSSGKSSLLYGVLGALQSSDFPFYYSPNGDYLTMGDFQEMAFGHNEKKRIHVRMTLGSSDGVESSFEAAFFSSEGKPKLHSLDASLPAMNLKVSRNDKTGVYTASCNLKKDGGLPTSGAVSFAQKMMQEIWEQKQKMKRGSAKDAAAHEAFKDVFFKRLKAKRFSFKDKNEFLIKANQNLFVSWGLEPMTAAFSNFKKRFNYISAFRLPPERTYYEKAKSSLIVDKFGDNAIQQIVEWADSGSKELGILKKALNALDLASNVRVQKHGAGRYELRLHGCRRKVECSLPDIGFGVSQFLPILVADLQMASPGTLAVCQPEIHLHPSTQAAYADFVVGSIESRKRRYLVETHSEYFLNRIRLLVAKKKLKKSDLSVYYLSPSSDRSVLHKIEFGEDGTISGAPEDFFATYMIDALDLALYA